MYKGYQVVSTLVLAIYCWTGVTFQ